jgi:type I restriction enzyme S subunit
MSEWQEVVIEELCSEITDCVNKTAPSVDYVTPYKMIRTTNIKQGRINLDEVRYVTEETYNTWIRRGAPQLEDIILTREAPVGEVGMIRTTEKVFLGQRTMMYRADQTKADPYFLYYAFQTEAVQEQILSAGMGSVVEHVRVPDAKKFKINTPPLLEQKAIASVLSSLDDKIDLLHRQNKTLEGMAETLFRQWFIEEAKEDWEDGALEQIIDLKYGKALKQEDRSGSGYPVLASSGIVGFHKDYLVQGPGIVIGRKGTLGKVYFMEDNFYPIDTSYFIQTKVPQSNLIFEYYLLKSLDFANMNSDSAVPGLNRNIALGTQIQIPSQESILEFNQIAQPWFCKLHSNTKQIQTLEKLRDTLLPKLMSGEVRVQYQQETAA